MRPVAQILLSNTQRVCNKKEGMMTAEEILRARLNDPAVTHSLWHLGSHRGRSESAAVRGDGGG